MEGVAQGIRDDSGKKLNNKVNLTAYLDRGTTKNMLVKKLDQKSMFIQSHNLIYLI